MSNPSRSAYHRRLLYQYLKDRSPFHGTNNVCGRVCDCGGMCVYMGVGVVEFVCLCVCV